jgi:hypothetical protein
MLRPLLSDLFKTLAQRQFVSRSPENMWIAVEGCCHGELDAIYATIAEAEKRRSIKARAANDCGG